MNREPKVGTTSAKVELTIEIDCSGGGWGPECQLSQVYKQAKETALGQINKIFSEGQTRVRIIGEPKVTAILHEEPRP